AAGSAAAVLLATRRQALAAPLAALRGYRTFWVESRWSLLGAATTEAQYRGYVFAVESFRGAATLGAVQAGRALMGPMQLLANAWG
uniref:hypothetical protein n=1 Tax=Klebsiella pneumoniae TaxID=573 RepID=UPI0013D35418